jgi:hypothetical protein
MKFLLIVIITLILMSACSRQESDEPSILTESGANAPEKDRSAQSAAANPNEIAEEYFEEFLKLNPVMASFFGDNRYNDQLAVNISPEHRRTSLALYKKYLGKLTSVDPPISMTRTGSLIAYSRPN